MYKIMTNKLPEWIYNFQLTSNLRRTGTRQAQDIVIPNVRTNMGSRSLVVRGPKYWNKLPSHIKKESSITTFKRKIKQHIVEDVVNNDN